MNLALRYSVMIMLAFAGLRFANATVVNADGNPLTSPTHPHAILDTSTNLLWLDGTETVNRSLADISSKLGAGQEFDGWQLASRVQIDQLFADAGLTDTNESWVPSVAGQTAVMNFVAIYGQTDTMPDLLGTTLWHANSLTTSDHYAMSALWTTTDDRYWVGHDGQGTGGEAIPKIGTALVRSAVPEPSTIALAITGLAAFSVRRCRTRVVL